MANSASLAAGTQAARAWLPPTPSSFLLRIRTWLLRPRLDGAIAHGLERRNGRTLALRKSQLIERRQRIRLALRLEKILTARPAPTLSSAAPIDGNAVEMARPLLTGLILTLRSSEPVRARGVALGWRLLNEPLSPVYASPGLELEDPGRLWRESLSVLSALVSPIPVRSGELSRRSRT